MRKMRFCISAWSLVATLVIAKANPSHGDVPSRDLASSGHPSVRQLDMSKQELMAAMHAAFSSIQCDSSTSTSSSTGTLPDGSEVTYTVDNYQLNCSDQGRTATLSLAVLEGQDGYGGTMEINVNNQWKLSVDFTSSLCTIETSTGEYCNCEICQTDSIPLGLSGSCTTSTIPYDGSCLGITALASGNTTGSSSGGNDGGAESMFGVTYDDLSSDLKSAYMSEQACTTGTGETAVELSCAYNGRTAFVSKSIGSDGIMHLDTLIVSSSGKFNVTVDFESSTCTVVRGGVNCDCQLCDDARGDFGVAASCAVDSSGSTSNLTSSFSGQCISVKDLADDGQLSTNAFDVVGRDLIKAYTAQNCKSSKSTSGNGTGVEYDLSCVGVDQSALMTGTTDSNGTLLLNDLTITANNAWFLSVDYLARTCVVQLGDVSCDNCNLCRSSDGGYGITVQCPSGGNTTTGSPFSSSNCVNVAKLARDSGNYQSDNHNTFDDVSHDIQSVFSVDMCQVETSQLNCSSVDGRTVTLIGSKAGNNSTDVEVSSLHIYIIGVYVIHLDVNTSKCSVELVNGMCDCTYCATSDGEFGLMSLCDPATTDFTRLTTGECVAVSDLSEGLNTNKTDNPSDKINAPPFFRLVSDIQDAFPYDACSKNATRDAYRETLNNGTQVYKSRNHLYMNCSYEGRTVYVNKTDDDGIEQMGKLNITINSNLSAAFDFETGSCLIEAEGTTCLNCTTCKFNNDKSYGISGYCPDASSDSIFHDLTCISVTDVAGGPFYDPTANSTTDDSASNSTQGQDDWANLDDTGGGGGGGKGDDATNSTTTDDKGDDTTTDDTTNDDPGNGNGSASGNNSSTAGTGGSGSGTSPQPNNTSTGSPGGQTGGSTSSVIDTHSRWMRTLCSSILVVVVSVYWL